MKKYIIAYLNETEGHNWEIFETDEEKLESSYEDVAAILNWNGTKQKPFIIEL